MSATAVVWCCGHYCAVVWCCAAVTKLLSRLSAALQEECSEPLSSSALQVSNCCGVGILVYLFI